MQIDGWSALANEQQSAFGREAGTTNLIGLHEMPCCF
jgi:hypothetical protein